MVIFSSSVNAERKQLNVVEKDFHTIFLGKKIPTKIFFPSKEPENVVIQFLLNDTKTEKKYFEKINFIFYNFLKNYKIGTTNKKKNLVLFTDDKRDLFTISFSDLKLLNNRDFGDNDVKKLVNTPLLPLKEIMKKGKFKENKNGIRKRFINFLNDYSFGLFETMVEVEYIKKDNKSNQVTWTIEKKRYDRDSVTYFVKCRPGGMTILTAIPKLNRYWDSHSVVHDTLSSAANKSCNK
jgi:hypothetical protein